MAEVALVTYRGLPELDFDDRPLIAALRGLGSTATPAIWDDPEVEWSRFDLAIVRSTWDYHTRRGEFLRWIETAEHATDLWNPGTVLRWNTDKRYLEELAALGIPTIPTRRIGPGSGRDLDALLEEEGWDHFVVKPSVSADSFRTGRFDASTRAEARRLVETILASSEAMVQPYYPNVETLGERSLLFLGGRFSHAIRKPASLGPDRSGGAVIPVPADADQRALARRVVAAAPAPVLYARIDLVPDPEGSWRVLEAEFTEPSLYLGWSEGAVGRFARAIARRVREAVARPPAAA